ncbi:undecaprenyl-phosphate glucose phosphotransferase [Alteromonas sp. 345S023]|uniref:Undecaprenyl-phosphate glucose phosphotransferase n=1 Tax=Alteromonas profundi TaxID=2696062 RepID=A0A7X5LIF6_9ALTE|nr:undecaprenyl-phosphate glucose phosphotransferase [Alteromonas profundi]NDV89945.1 undecaprenyl-phosphate glucose phosphotransferase [Alteromonas profundi]
MDNRIESSKVIKSHPIESKRSGLAVKNKTGFSTLYRLTDLSLVTLLYYSCAMIFGALIDTTSLVFLLVNVICFLIAAEGMELYRSWRGYATFEMLRAAAVTWVLSAFGTLTIGYFFVEEITTPPLVVLVWLATSFVALLAWRFVMRKFLFLIRKSGLNSRRSIVIGATALGSNVATQICENEHLGIRFNGMFDDREPSRLNHKFQNSVLGNIEAAIEMAKRNEVDYIYIALPMSAENRIRSILEQCSDTTANVYVVPNFFMFNLLNARWQTIGNMQTLSVYDTPFQGANDILKRFEDIILSSLILTMISIPMLCIAAAVKMTSRGPVIFKQKRYGLDGKQITIYKFRSMTTQDNGAIVKQATKNDARLTKIGGFLRRTSLDELPQFINVLQGRMSIVGPRPHAVAHNEEYRKIITGYMLRHKVKPGITGWAQVNGLRGETETTNKMVKRVEYDLDYIHQWSLWFDLKIVFMTIFNGFINKNAY